MHFISSSYTQKGLFFQRPIVKRSIYSCSWLSSTFQKILMCIFTPIAFKRYLDNARGKLDCDGVYIPRFCFPIVRQRNCRRSIAVFPDDCMIKKIVSWGYEHKYNEVGGQCEKEITTIFFRDGKKRKITTKGEYNFIYKINLQQIENNRAIAQELYDGYNLERQIREM